MVSLFIASFVLVFIRAFQQRNVAFDRYLAILPTSLLFAAADVYVVITVVNAGFKISTVLSMGIGAGLGAMLAMFIHKKVFK